MLKLFAFFTSYVFYTIFEHFSQHFLYYFATFCSLHLSYLPGLPRKCYRPDSTVYRVSGCLWLLRKKKKFIREVGKGLFCGSVLALICFSFSTAFPPLFCFFVFFISVVYYIGYQVHP